MAQTQSSRKGQRGTLDSYKRVHRYPGAVVYWDRRNWVAVVDGKVIAKGTEKECCKKAALAPWEPESATKENIMKTKGELRNCERCKGKGCRACHGHGIVAVIYAPKRKKRGA